MNHDFRLRSPLWPKRLFDIVFSFIGLVFFSVPIFLAWVCATISTRSNGFFVQTRVGRSGKLFALVKIKTMRSYPYPSSTVTCKGDVRITSLGRFLRKYKIDELPQLWNVLIGDMSFVGPRPDVPGFADELIGDDRIILDVPPGITGPASLKYFDEEKLLSTKLDPISFNRNVIWPDKVRINVEYVKTRTLLRDLQYICMTFLKP